MHHTHILEMKVSHTDYTHAAATILNWARQRESRYVCVASVNNIMEAYDSPTFLTIMNNADLVTPDGMPVVWAMRLLGNTKATRVYGPDLTEVLLDRAAAYNISVGFYGGAPHVLERLVGVVRQRHPGLSVSYAYSPPFREPSPQEDHEIVKEINTSSVQILFIGLNTPKQDHWMAAHKGRVGPVMVGVGAAFDFLSGSKAQAPRWMMKLGLEWCFRLITEPRRLWKRYFKHNPRYIVYVASQIAAYWSRRMSTGLLAGPQQ